LQAKLAVVERRGAGDHGKERTLARAVAADEADALARLHGERRAVEERQLAVGEVGVEKRDERHGGASLPAGGVPGRASLGVQWRRGTMSAGIRL